MDLDYLIASGERRGRVYKASDDLRKVAVKKMTVEEPTRIHDLFETKEPLIGL
jgi:hypothetical protein